MQLTQKETELLKDLQDQEKLCVEKYNKHWLPAEGSVYQNRFRRAGTLKYD